MRTLSTIFIAILLTVAISGTADAQWVQTNCPENADWGGQFFAVSDSNLFILQRFDFGVHLYVSSDFGTSWSHVAWVPTGMGGFGYRGIRGFTTNGQHLFFGDRYGLFRSMDNGITWDMPSIDSVENSVLALTFFGPSGAENLYAGAYWRSYTPIDSFSFGVYRSTDDGDSWTKMSSQRVDAFGASGANLFAGTEDGGVFRSTDYGSNWMAVNTGLTDSIGRCFAANPSAMFTGTAHGVFHTTDNGASWNATSLTSNVNGLIVSGNNVFAVAGRDTIFLSSNNGTSWTAVTTSLADSMVEALIVHGPYLFAAARNGVWRRPLSEMITNDVKPTDGLPTRYGLTQNYPNPFNPTTTISYQLPSQSQVTLKVFDVLGREVVTLVNGVEELGYKSVNFNSNGLSSGIYYYRLQAGSYVETKKLLLLR